MAILVDPLRQERRAQRGEGKAPAAQSRALRILAVVDGSERTGRVINYVRGLHALRTPLEVILLNVQPMPEDWRLRGYGSFKRQEIRNRLVDDLGRPVVESAGRQLDNADIPHKSCIELGGTSETICDAPKRRKPNSSCWRRRPPALFGAGSCERSASRSVLLRAL